MTRIRLWSALTAGLCVVAASVAAVPSAGAAPKPQRFIVAFADGGTTAGMAAVAAAGGEVVLELGPQNAAAVELPASAVSALAAKSSIRYIEPDVERYPMAYSNVADGGQTLPYGVQMVQGDLFDAPDAANIVVGVIDSGVFAGHADIADDVMGTTGDGSADLADGCGHGTHVSGTIAGLDNGLGVVGVDPGREIVSTKVFGEDCAWAYSSGLVAALNATLAEGVDVVNMSLGGSRSSRTERAAMDAAYAEGVLLVAAAGNDGNTRTSYPAGYDSVISVAAVDSEGAIASFSQQNSTVELAAPGVGVLSTVPFANTAIASAGAVSVAGSAMEGSATTSASGVTGALVDGGLCKPATTKGKPGGGGATPNWTGKVVLCQRGDITFGEKVDYVVSAGGVAAIIYNNVAGDFSGTLGSTKKIPAISVSDTQGAQLKSVLGVPTTVVVSIAKPASGYEAWDGTSMATPHVAGVAAKIWSVYPSATNTQVRAALTASASDLGPIGRDNAFGYGLVQAQDALDELAALVGAG